MPSPACVAQNFPLFVPARPKVAYLLHLSCPHLLFTIIIPSLACLWPYRTFVDPCSPCDGVVKQPASSTHILLGATANSVLRVLAAKLLLLPSRYTERGGLPQPPWEHPAVTTFTIPPKACGAQNSAFLVPSTAGGGAKTDMFQQQTTTDKSRIAHSNSTGGS